MIKTSAIDSLTNFQKNAKAFMDRLERTKEPVVLTVNGKAKLVVQDAEAYQAMIDEVDRSRFIEAIRQGLSEAKQGLEMPADEVFARMKAKHGL